ncbi:MAG: class II aldolase/adducin family protein [Candidatus Thalassarchaeaceae archaeon]|jgi:L-fuculose-phosphate aldolase|nr:class II aldolase/adducin family protein [Candidatus Thalassarchaeaceae archaeon]
MQTGSGVVVNAGVENTIEKKKIVDSDEKAELERLRGENEELRQGMAVAAEVIQDVENPPMPPIVGDGFVVPGEVVGMFSSLGRQLHKERLIHGTAGSFSMLSRTQPGLVHISRRGAALGQLNESDIVTGRLGEAGPNGAHEDWQIHSVGLAISSLEYEGLGACIHVQAPYTTTMSMEKDRYALIPKDHDGKTRFGRATIVDVQYKDMEGYLVEITEALKQTGNKLFVARGHGIYALGSTLLEAWGNAAAFEHSMRILYLSELADL